MKPPIPFLPFLSIALMVGIIWAFPQSVEAQRYVSEMDQRVAPHSFLQKSLAYNIKDFTLEFTGINVAGTQYLFKSDVPGTNARELEFIYFGLYNATFARKMANGLTYGINGRLLTQDPQVGDPTTRLETKTEGRFDVYVKGIWGQLSYGDYDERDILLISGRNSLTGEANLVFDAYLNPSLERAFRYRARYGAWLVDMALDEDAKRWNAGFQFRTKSGIFEKAYSMNYSGGEILGRYDRHTWSLGHQLVYGSWDLTAGVTWEHLDPLGNFQTFDRVAASLGTGWKKERLTLGAGVLFTEVNNGGLGVVATAGMRYDFSRGRSFNLGYIHADTDGLTSDGFPMADAQLSGLRLSFAYRY